MDNFYLSSLVQEVTPELQDRTVVRVSLANSTLLLDLRLSAGRQLRISLDRATPAFYLSTEVPNQSSADKHNATFFLSLLRKHLIDARLVTLRKDPLDRIVHLEFERRDAGDNRIKVLLTLAFTGRSANAYLIDANATEIGALFEQDAARRDIQPTRPVQSLDRTILSNEMSGASTQVEVLERFFGDGSSFPPQLKNEFLARCRKASPSTAFKSLLEDLLDNDPRPLLYSRLPLEQIQNEVINPRTDLLLSHIELEQALDLTRYQFASLSEAADRYYTARGIALSLRADYSALKQTLTREVEKRESTIKAIEMDHARFDDPERLKRHGDLILANLTSARIDGGVVTVVDYYADDQREIQIEIPAGATLKEAASTYFGRYQKARRALATIAAREQEVLHKLDPLRELLFRLEQEPTSNSIEEVSEATGQILGTKRGVQRGEKRTKEKGGPNLGRKFRSSDGYEIVVGRNNRDNDAITFQVAKPNDIWLHAADYPGSHTIIRNSSRFVAPPHRTITEAAELAAFYSQAKREGKAAIHYTRKKFVSKPPRAKPGLVRLSSFKTIVVEPRCDLERIE